jgi:hypothetical protein
MRREKDRDKNFKINRADFIVFYMEYLKEELILKLIQMIIKIR